MDSTINIWTKCALTFGFDTRVNPKVSEMATANLLSYCSKQLLSAAQMNDWKNKELTEFSKPTIIGICVREWAITGFVDPSEKVREPLL
jgi:hypothetical protein